MSALDIRPPSAPNAGVQKKRGFFSRLFTKEEAPEQQRQTLHGLEDEQFDLDEIRRKLGVEEHPPLAPIEEPLPQRPMTQPAPVEEELPALPATRNATHEEEFNIDDWSAEPAKKEPSPAQEWSTPLPKIEKSDASPWTEHPETAGVKSGSEWAAHVDEPTKSVDESPSEWNDEKSSQNADQITFEPEVETTVLVTPTPPVKPAEVQKIGEEHLQELHEQHEDIEEKLTEILDQINHPAPDAEHPMDQEAPEGNEFILKNGQPLKSLRDLRTALEAIDTETFFHHVNEQKNDFAAWIYHIFQEEELAKKLERQKARKDILKTLKEHERQTDKEYRESGKELKHAVKNRLEHLKQLKSVDKDLEDLKAQLAQKTMALEALKEQLNAEVNKRIAAELEKRLKEERTNLAQRHKEIEKKRLEYDRKNNLLQKREQDLEKKQTMRQDSLKRLEITLKTGQEELDRKKAEAQTLLQQGEKAKADVERVDAMLKTAEQQRAAVQADQAALQQEREKLKQDQQSLNGKQLNVSRREAEVKKERELLLKREQDLAKKETKIAEDRAQLAATKTEFEHRVQELEQREKEAIGKITSAEKQANLRLKKALDTEKRADDKLQERKKIASYVEEAEKKIDEHERRVGRQGMQSFLSKKFSSLKGKSEPTVPPPGNIRNLKIYTMIDQARDALQKGDTKEARSLYNKIREAFNKEELTPSEKSVLYTTIRELYDDIHLAAMK